MNKKSVIFVCCGFLFLMLGSMLLNGYFGFYLHPDDFHHDSFIGSTSHLLAGLIPWLLGIVFVVLGSTRVVHILVSVMIGFSMAFLFSLPAIINAKDHAGYVGWFAIVTIGIVMIIATRALVNMYNKRSNTDALLRAG